MQICECYQKDKARSRITEAGLKTGLGANGRRFDREAIAARCNIKLERNKFVAAWAECFGAGIADTPLKAVVGLYQCAVLDTERREAVDLALAQVIGANVVVIVIFMTIRTAQFELTIAGVIHFLTQGPSVGNGAVGGNIDGHTA